MNRYFVLNKPYNMLSQFKGNEQEIRMLGELDFDFPEGIHAVGRLDATSEGLLLLTTNKRVTNLLFQGKEPHSRTYHVMVRNNVSDEKLQQLRNGVRIRISGDEYYTTPPCEANIIPAPVGLVKREGDITREVPHTWLSITIFEGKFRQVRKMVQAIGHPCKRLIRVSIEDIHLGSLEAGGVKEMDETEFFRLLKIVFVPPAVSGK
ncbi:pseudouridine synthase [Chitinophaga barathri]|uniref:Pseudouridine synthase n=1 Tax=Chitinophaga barathri TaxID=1647451 RepID=A0A3N4MDB5_9BACT|nr:pseudouridine synthase [Chitinophaga barathri]RPD41854.1 pseudouridine synthase [Chitinophaga barathri]